MKYIKNITPDELNSALRRYFGVATADDIWEVKAVYALDGELCYATTDDNCYYYLNSVDNNFVYWAFNKNESINIKGLFEVLVELVKEGHPFIKVNGTVGRYRKILKAFDHYSPVKVVEKENEGFVFYIGHPDNIEKFIRRINK